MGYLKKLKTMFRDGTFREMAAQLRWMGGYAWRYRGEVVAYTLMGLLGIGMLLGASVVSKHIIDAVTGLDTTALLPATSFYVGMQLVRIGLNALTTRLSVAIRVDVEQQIRSDVYGKVLRADWEALSVFHSGDILNRVDKDVTSVAGGVLGWIPDLLCRLVQFVGTLAVILYYDPTLALLALLSAPVTVAVSGVLMGRMRSHSQAVRELSSRVTAFHQESFQNVKTIKAFGLTDVYNDKLNAVQQEYRQVQLGYNRFQVRTSAAMGLVGTVVSMVCFGWSAYRLWSGSITYGTMTLFLQLAASLSGAFSALVQLVPAMISGITAAGRVMALTDLPREETADPAQAQEFYRAHRRAGLGVQARELYYGYAGDKTVLEAVSFQAKPGEVVALIGPSGEGKTTLLRLILGVLHPASGQLALTGEGDDLPVSAATRSLFAYVPQTRAMFSGTVRDNLKMMNPDATDELLWEALRIASADGFVSRLPQGLDSPVQERGGGFSHGQVQRLMLARALVADVPVLLLDEATSALDPHTERKVLRALRTDAGKRTCIITTHRPGLLQNCDRVYRLNNKTLEHLTREEACRLMLGPESKEEAHG